MQRLSGRVAIVTGSAWGIGGASARRLAEDGAKVLVADVDLEGARANAARIKKAGGVAEAIRTDVGRSADIQAMVARAVELWGRLDILVNNAYRTGDGAHNPSTEVDEAVWDREFAVLVKALYLGCKYAVPHMLKNGKGSIVNIASVHGLLTSGKGWQIYDTAKTGVIGITRQMAVEWGPQGIRANAICPGFILTEASEPRFKKPESVLLVNQMYPVRRHGVPVDIANAVAFLCSDEASFITGVALPVDGGLTVQLQDSLSAHIARYAREHPEAEVR